jgi:ferredoxin
MYSSILQGNRATVPARIGRSLLETVQMHKIDIEGPCRGGGAPTDVQRTPIWNETTFGEGPSCFLCHVQIPSQFKHLLPREASTEGQGLREVWGEEANVSSRLACQINLEKKHDGMVVFVPDAPPSLPI